MKRQKLTKAIDENGVDVEFDAFAENYNKLLEKSIQISGEKIEFFSSYKINDLKNIVKKHGIKTKSILDFGCGNGNSAPFFESLFPDVHITYADKSSKSILQTKSKAGLNSSFLQIKNSTIDLGSNCFDIVYSACVFHHINKNEHEEWLTELLRVLRDNGLIVIYEHNPINPVTRWIVKNSPLDMNATLVTAKEMQVRLVASGFRNPIVLYRSFFPSKLKSLRFLERYIHWLPLGAQYMVIARK